MNKQLPRLEPTQPAAAVATFKTHADFKLIQVAAEPMVSSPVAVCFDEDQRLYVVEMGDYPFIEDTPKGRVRLLEDRDNDGIYDHATVFLDRLPWPTSVVPHEGGVFVAAAPDILYAKDTDGDGRANVRKVVFTGFGTQNVQALVNGLIWGLDGWVYGASGGDGGEIRNLQHPANKPVSVRGRDFRFKPDGSAFEALSGGGQFGHCFDDWGHRFVCNNSNHIRQIVLPSHYLDRNPNLAAPSPIVDIAAEGPAAPVFRISPPEPWRVVRTRQRAADPEFVKRAPATELVATGFFTSATGITIYRGSALGEDTRGNAFVGDVGGNLVHRKRLETDGVKYKAIRADDGIEFLASTDNWFRPVNFANTPDGTLLIVDMYREAIEHPASIPDEIKKHLDLTSGKERGRLYNLVPERFRKRPPLALSRATTSELVSLLADGDAYWRETAQRLLREQPERDTVPLLHSFLHSSESPLGKLHALWTLENLNALQFEDVNIAVRDREPRLRENAARLLESLVKGDPRAAAALVELAGDPDAMVRLQTAFSLGYVKSPDGLEGLKRMATASPADATLRAAVLSSLAGRSDQFAARLGPLSDLVEKPGGPDWLETLSEIRSLEQSPSNIAEAIVDLGSRLGDPHGIGPSLRGFARGLNRQRRAVSDLFRAANIEFPNGLVERAERMLKSAGPDDARVNAVGFLTLVAPERAAIVLPELLGGKQSNAVQLAAVKALGALNFAGVGNDLLKRWPSLSPALRLEAIEVVLSRSEWTQALLAALQSSDFPLAELDSARRARLLMHPNKEIRERAALLLGASSSNRSEIVARYQSAAQRTGSTTRGRALYQQHCATCHRAEGAGHQVGPDLATVANRAPDNLLVQVMDPNREVPPNYVVYSVGLKDGRMLSGMLVDENARTVTLLRAEGVRDVLFRDQIDELRSSGVSLMPEGLENQLDPQALADLIAYISSLGAGRP